MRNDRKNVSIDKSFQFALKIVTFCGMREESKKYVISGQLLRSCTSIGANIREAQYAESKAELIHKLKIAAKEAGGTEYWLLLCKNSSSYPFDEQLVMDADELIKILSKIISTSKNK